MMPARQVFKHKETADWKTSLKDGLAATLKGSDLAEKRIAVTAGSRGIYRMPEYIREIGRFLREQGADPFVVPAMGSHGGATASGQIQVLKDLGITEESVEMRIVSSMDTVLVGRTESGLPAYMVRNAFEADGIVLINRIKTHTNFHGKFESGLMKMLVIGLGKYDGADHYHRAGMKQMPRNIEEVGRFLLSGLNVLCGVGLVEDAYDKTSEIAVIPAEKIPEAEPELLKHAKANMPEIKLKGLDVLIVDQIGKNFSGSGMDPNVTGRYYDPSVGDGETKVTDRIVVLGLSPQTHGNACGLGVADTTTRRVVEARDREAVYVNGLTALISESGRIPLYFENDREAIQAAIKLTGKRVPEELRIVRIKNTAQLEDIWISPALAAEAAVTKGMDILGPAVPLPFDDEGNL